MRCFITGAAGFIGSHLTERLLTDGHSVTGFDNLSSGRIEWLAAVRNHPLFEFCKGDLLDSNVLKQAMSGHDTIFHLAANGDIQAAFGNPRLDVEQGILATFNVLEAMRLTGASRLIFTSSGSVFGMADIVPTPETIGPLFPMSMYAASKAACEGFISATAHTFGLQAWTFRFGNVVGDRMSRGVIHDFIMKLRKNPAELEILGDGEQEKSYILVEEVIDGMLFTLTNVKVDPCDIFNLSHAETTIVKDIARIVVEEMGLRDVTLRYTGGKGGWPGDQPLARLDVSKLHQLGWRAKHSSAEAVHIATTRLLAQQEL